jgi:ribosomal protein S18 acetylase RimI-like enzyme
VNYKYCEKDAIYRCGICGRPICGEHAKFRTLCTSCIKKTSRLNYSIDKAKLGNEKEKIQEFVKQFWGEEEQLTFDRKFIVADLPAYIAKAGKNIVGFASFAELRDTTIIVAIGILPTYQNAGIGKSLIEKVETEAKKLGKKKLLVSTSNDDLPALAFYQSLGFQIYQVKPNIIAEKHGKVLKGIGGLPIRDELRLQKTLK